MKTYGLIGKSLFHSFSPEYFNKKFKQQHIKEVEYLSIELEDILLLPEYIQNHPNLSGLNVTLPFKETVLPLLDSTSEAVKRIGAVNTIQFKEGKCIGHNTDVIGFKESLTPLFSKLKSPPKKAFILGTGGASKAIQYVLDELKIEWKLVSRTPSSKKEINYSELDNKQLNNIQLIVNTTPLGTFPNVEECPPIPYQYITNNCIAYDLVYNPSETLFLKKCSQKGALVKNGLEMLQLQADASWKIWNQ